MGSYIPATGEERQAMLQAIGLTSVEELFDVVPEAVRVKNLDLPEGLSEWEVSQTMASPAKTACKAAGSVAQPSTGRMVTGTSRLSQ